MSKTPNIQYPISTPQAAIRAWANQETLPMVDLYVITDPTADAYHRRDPGRTGRLLCGLNYLLLDDLHPIPPPDKTLCPGCARALQDRQAGRPPHLIGDEKSAHSPHPRSKEHHE
jgi:hypothetical protein